MNTKTIALEKLVNEIDSLEIQNYRKVLLFHLLTQVSGTEFKDLLDILEPFPDSDSNLKT